MDKVKIKSPKWHRDEIILALDLYFKSDRGAIDDKNPKIIYLSEVLNRLPIHTNRPDIEKFRNPNGVTLKLSNFLAIDPEYSGKGMESYSKLDKLVFEEFRYNKEQLQKIASELYKISNSAKINEELSSVDDDDYTESIKEGKILYRLHKLRERNQKLVKAKKEAFIRKNGRLFCEICEFDFKETYGNIGEGFIECHHKTPLSETTVERETKLVDLVLVCSNCHRMLHKAIDTVTIEGLRLIIEHC